MKPANTIIKVAVVFFSINIFPIILKSQEIQWNANLSWLQVKEKAKSENKHIFMDCYTTWCLPCKQMDKDVFSNNRIADAINKNFIAVKVQMDSNRNDDIFRTGWYRDAKEIKKEYGITGYPTFLFFSPEGKIVAREVGLKTNEDFLTLLNSALDPKIFEELMSDYRKGKKDYANIPFLINKASKLNQKDDYNLLVNDYLQYMETHKKEAIYTKQNVKLIVQTFEDFRNPLLQPGNPLLKKFYQDNKYVDSILGENRYMQWVTKSVIWYKEVFELFSKLMSEKRVPDWDLLSKNIMNEYGYPDSLVHNFVRAYKLNWYEKKGEFDKCFLLIDELHQQGWKNDKGDDWRINTMAYLYVFLQSTESTLLNKAITWMKGVVERSKNKPLVEHLFEDTYANLLYKAGKTKEAIAHETRALELLKSQSKASSAEQIKIYSKILSKMKNNIPTWPAK